MKLYNLLALTILILSAVSCENTKTPDSDFFEISIIGKKRGYRASDMVSLVVKNKKNKAVDSVVYKLNSSKIASSKSLSEISISLDNQKLGEQLIQTTIYSEGKTFVTGEKIILLSSIKPKLYTYKVLETYPHDIKAYTQGLEFVNDTLYESTGTYKMSSLRKTNYKTGAVLKQVDLADSYFGEGLTIMNDNIYQLTWRENTGFIYDLSNMNKTGSFVYGASKEGWGLCNDGAAIYKSDGTQKIWTLDPDTLAEIGYIELYTNTSKIPKVNELEWVEGKIYANIYEKDAIAIVDPSNGAVEGVIDLSDLKSKVTQHKDLDVLNGIAYKGEENILYITGKNWDSLFKVEIMLK